MQNLNHLLSLYGIVFYQCRNTGTEKSQRLGWGKGKKNERIFWNHDIVCSKAVSQTNTKRKFTFSIGASPLMLSPTFQIQFY